METEQRHAAPVTDMRAHKPVIATEVQLVSETKDMARLQVDIHLWKDVFVDDEQTYGTRALANMVAVNYFQAIEYPDDLPGLLSACQSLLPRIARNAELTEIFLTTMEFMAEEKRLRNAWFDAKTPEEKKEAMQAWNECNRRDGDYYRSLIRLYKIQPFSESYVQCTQPRFCEEALKCSLRLETVPQEHLKACAICLSS